MPGLWLIALCAACGATAGERFEEEDGTTESVSALSTPVTPTAPQSSSGETTPAGADSGSGPPAGASGLAAPAPPVSTPPSGEPSPLPHAALDTSRSLDRLAPAEVVIEPGNCRFEFLGESVRCENAGSASVLETDARDLVSCMRQCLERDDCSAVTDYLWLGLPGRGCYLYLSTCDEPVPSSTDEDAGRDFRRRCDPASTD